MLAQKIRCLILELYSTQKGAFGQGYSLALTPRPSHHPVLIACNIKDGRGKSWCELSVMTSALPRYSADGAERCPNEGSQGMLRIPGIDQCEMQIIVFRKPPTSVYEQSSTV